MTKRDCVKYLFCLGLLLAVAGFNQVKATDDLYYDLKVDSITVTPASPAVDQSCKITVKIKNVGTWQIFSSSGLSSYSYNFARPALLGEAGDNFSLDSFTRTYPSFDNIIWPNDFITYTFIGTFTEPGETDLVFSVNDDQSLSEQTENSEGYLVSSYDNNSLNKTITVAPDSYDLELKKVEFSNNYPIVNGIVNITYTIKNSGEASLITNEGLVESSFPVNITDYYITTKTIAVSPTIDNPFDPGEEFTVTYVGYFSSAGDKEIDFELDRKKQIIETNENNNATTTLITVYRNQTAADEFNILSLSHELVSSTEANISWTADRDVTGTLTYERSGIDPRQVNFSTAKKEQFYDLRELTAGYKYKYKIEAYNGVVEHATSWQSFTLPSTDDLLLSTPLNVSISGSSARFNWSTNLIASRYVYYKNTSQDDYANVGETDNSYDHELSLTDLEAGEYDYYIESRSGTSTVYKSEAAQFTIGQAIPGDSSQVSDQATDAGATDSSDETVESTPVQTTTQTTSADTEIDITNNSLYSSLQGKIILKVEANGEAYYVDPSDKKMYYLGRPADAFAVMREQGVGITTANLEKIPVGLSNLSGIDSDGDGLTDMFEDAIGTDKNLADSDGDGYNDKVELEGNYNPSGTGDLNLSTSFSEAQAGKIFLQVENNGEAWYVNPTDKKRYFLGRPADAFNVMRNLGLGISNSNFDSM